MVVTGVVATVCTNSLPEFCITLLGLVGFGAMNR